VTTAVEPRRAAVIFRKRLLPWSETFIGAQVGAMTRYHPVLAGYSRDRRGAVYIEGREQLLLDEHSAMPGIERLLLKAGRVPRRWLAAIAATDPALVHAHFGTNAPPAILIARRLGVPFLVTYHGVDITSTARTAAQQRRRHHVFTSASRVIAVSNFIARALRDAGCPPDRIAVHYIGVNTEFFAPDDRVRAPTRVLHVARLVRKKGLIHLIRAMERVRVRVPDAELIVAGEGPLRTQLEREAAARRVPCTFLGVQPPAQVRELMRSATVLCGPGVIAASGDAEGLGIIFLEAQAVGLPVIASTAGGIAEGIVDGETGLLHAPGDEDALTSHLIALLTDPERRARFGAAGRAHVLRSFDLRRQTAQLESLYDDVCRQGARSVS
jgi:glycosyltransferase involved in cell wall biosynthesis